VNIPGFLLPDSRDTKPGIFTNRLIAEKRVLNNLEKKLAVIEKSGLKLLSDVSNGIGQYDRLLLETKEDYRLQMNYVSFLTKGKKDKNIFSTVYNKENFIYNANVFCKNNGLTTKVVGFSEQQIFSQHPSIKCQCECGDYFDMAISSLTNCGKTHCAKCTAKKSKWCRKVEEFLNKNNLTFQNEIYFEDLKDRRFLRFDYKLDINGGLIEVDGEQHFDKDRCWKGMTREQNEIRFKTTQYHDRLKNEYCKENNIKLLRINYKEIKDNSYKDKILNFVEI